jgi:hypothetical protein
MSLGYDKRIVGQAPNLRSGTTSNADRAAVRVVFLLLTTGQLKMVCGFMFRGREGTG